MTTSLVLRTCAADGTSHGGFVWPDVGPVACSDWESTAGDGGTATVGYGGAATAGDRGTVCVRWYDGRRYRLTIGYVGEDGIDAGTAYRCDTVGQLVAVAA